MYQQDPRELTCDWILRLLDSIWQNMKLDKAEFINMGFKTLARTPGNCAIVLLDWFIEAS